jgi:hypothetical protein
MGGDDTRASSPRHGERVADVRVAARTERI